MSESLDSTAERMIPTDADAYTFWEHIYRYRFALDYVRGKRVLDIACGSGYGTAAIARAGAKSVLGVDIDPKVCAYVSRHYGVPTAVGSAENIPLPDASVDVVVSFETIEHVPSPALFVEQCHRVLVPGGVLVISTPNREVYRELSPHNPYHHSELDAGEFASVLDRGFFDVTYYAQRLLGAPWWDWRGAAADQWFSRRIPGIGRLVHSLRIWGGVPGTADVTEQYRRDPVAAILTHPKPLARSLVDPYALRRRSANRIGRSVYTVAVGRRR